MKNTMWTIQLLGDIDNNDFELSVIRVNIGEEEQPLGFRSYGWGSEDKIILFGNGIGKNSFNPSTPEKVKFADSVAELLCEALNKNQL